MSVKKTEKNGKTLVCSDCGSRTEKVESSTREVICSFCVQYRLSILDEVGPQLFKRIFYTLEKGEGRELLSCIIKQKTETKLSGASLRRARKKKRWKSCNVLDSPNAGFHLPYPKR